LICIGSRRWQMEKSPRLYSGNRTAGERKIVAAAV
jgi:hypothetical protein